MVRVGYKHFKGICLAQKRAHKEPKRTTRPMSASWFVRSSHPRASRFSMAAASATCRASGQIRRAKRASLKRKRLHYNRKKASRLGHLPAVLSFVVRDAFSYAGVHFHSPTLSSALSNTETIGSTSQKARRKLEEDAAIEKRSRTNLYLPCIYPPSTVHSH